ncbi:MAG: hypothetical protein ACM3SY_01640 [Candidatus Omnitrophota bacterium]
MKYYPFKLMFMAFGTFILFTFSGKAQVAESKETTKKVAPITQVLSFSEFQANKKQAIAIDPNPNKLSIVDINSKIIITIDKAKVKEKAVELTGGVMPPELLAEIDTVTQILNQQTDILSILDQKKNTTPEQRKTNLEKFSSSMLGLLKFLAKDPAYREKVNAALSASPDNSGTAYRSVFALVGERIENLQSHLNASYAGVNFRMGAWLKTKYTEIPIHIDGFDAYQQGDFYKYSFFTVPTTLEAQSKFFELQNAAVRFNAGGLSAMFDVKDILRKVSDFVQLELLKNLACVTEEGTRLQTLLGQSTRQLVLTRQPLVTREPAGRNQPSGNDRAQPVVLPDMGTVLARIDTIKALANVIGNASKLLITFPADLPTQVQSINDISSLTAQIKGLIQELRTKLADIRRIAQTNAAVLGRDKVTMILNQVRVIETACIPPLENPASGTLNNIDSFIGSLRTSSLMLDEQARTALQLGDSVSRFLADQIPDKGTIDLQYTGNRDEGDEIYIKAVLERKSDTTPSNTLAPQTLVGDKLVILYNIVSIKINIGMIFANPFNRTNIGLKPTFQAAPSYSVLLELGNRKSVTYNRFLKLGVGLNVAALDFNQDSTYELGVGLVVSALHDYVQVGVGKNLSLRNTYWFLGIKLPFGSLTIPGVISPFY